MSGRANGGAPDLRVFFMADHLGHRGGRVHGGTTYYVNTIPELIEAGVSVTSVFMGPRHPAVERLEARGVSPTFLGLEKWDPRSFTAFRSLLDSRRHDVLHLHSFKSHLAGRLAGRQRRLPSIVHVHDHIRMKQPLRFFQRCLGPGTAALVGITDSVTRFGVEEYRVPPERSYTVPHGIDLSPMFRAAAAQGRRVRRELGTPPEQPLLAVIGRVNTDKGQDQLLRTMPKILAESPEAELWVVGEGPDRAEFEALAGELGVDRSVKFLGQRSDIPAVLAAVDFTVMPSMWQEGFGLVALESLAAGKPVVAFRSGGVATVVQHEHTGLLVDQGDLDGLADAVLRLLEDPDQRRRLGEQGREHAKSFDPDLHVERMVDVYRRAIAWVGNQGEDDDD